MTLTGLSVDDLRARIAEPALQAAVLAFLAGNEADLVACAEDLDLGAEEFAIAAEMLAR